MTPAQHIREAKFVFIHFMTANGSHVNLNISKGELRRFIKEDGADPADTTLWTWIFTGSLHITFHS